MQDGLRDKMQETGSHCSNGFGLFLGLYLSLIKKNTKSFMQEENSAGFQRMDGFVQLLPRAEDGHWYVIVTQALGHWCA